LDEKLQKSFYNFLKERKIDDDLSFFILSYSNIKEQNEYKNWLKKFYDFTNETKKLN
jgi:hypothetical protein